MHCGCWLRFHCWWSGWCVRVMRASSQCRYINRNRIQLSQLRVDYEWTLIHHRYSQVQCTRNHQTAALAVGKVWFTPDDGRDASETATAAPMIISSIHGQMDGDGLHWIAEPNTHLLAVSVFSRSTDWGTVKMSGYTMRTKYEASRLRFCVVWKKMFSLYWIHVLNHTGTYAITQSLTNRPRLRTL